MDASTKLTFLLVIVACTYTSGQVLDFTLVKKDGNYIDVVEPNYFDSLILYPSENSDGFLNNSHGMLYNSEHGNFEFGIVKNILDDSSDLLVKVSFGWFPLTDVTKTKDSIKFSWDWDYRPDPNDFDIEILQWANELLSDETYWNSNDDRECNDDVESRKWSLYCALYQASEDVLGDFNHRNAAMETVRATINEITPDKTYRHRLMDFNNQNSFDEIKELLSKSIEKLQLNLEKR